MAQNNLTGLTVSELISLTQTFYNYIAALPTPNPYGIDALTLGTLQERTDDLIAADTAQSAAYAAAYGETQNKATQKTALLNYFRPLVNELYANPALTPQQIADTGLAVRDTTGTPITPITPTNVVATPFANGDVFVSWARSGNANSVIFSVQHSTDAINWEILTSSTRTRIKLSGFDPGVESFFRVLAQVGSVVATPSNPVVIYPPAEPVSLPQAA